MKPISFLSHHRSSFSEFCLQGVAKHGVFGIPGAPVCGCNLGEPVRSCTSNLSSAPLPPSGLPESPGWRSWLGQRTGFTHSFTELVSVTGQCELLEVSPPWMGRTGRKSFAAAKACFITGMLFLFQPGLASIALTTFVKQRNELEEVAGARNSLLVSFPDNLPTLPLFPAVGFFQPSVRFL